MTNNAILLYDGHHGIYIPKICAEDIIKGYVKVKNIDDIKWELGELGNPDNESYWDAWSNLMGKAIFTNKFGTEYYLYQDDDVWAVPVGESFNDGWD
jgi:hypothetical protein